MTHRCTLAFLLLAAAAAPLHAQGPLPLTLDEAVRRAIDVSHRLAEAAAREAGAAASVRVQEAAMRPAITASAGYTRTNHVEEFGVASPDGGIRVIYPDIPDNVFSRLSLHWPIYSGGRVDALRRAAAAEVQAAAADAAAARADLRLEVVRAYWALATASESLRVLTAAVARAEAHVAEVRSRFDNGLIPPNEVASAESQRSRQQVLAIEARNLRAGAQEELRRLTGVAGDIDPADALEPAPAPPPPSVSAASRPEIAALTGRVEAADERRRAAEAGRRPTISVTGAVDYANPNPHIFPRRGVWRESWEVGVAASWTLWDGGRVSAAAAEAAAAVAASRARLAELDSQIALDISQRMLAAESARAALPAAAETVRSAAEARRVVGERFAIGVATSTDVLDAQVALLQAELDRTRALANVRLADARLQRALGQ